MNELERWKNLWHRAGARGNPEPVFSRLEAAYGEPHRFYHVMGHITFCFKELIPVRRLVPLEDMIPLEFAFFYHDAVYDVRAHDNEFKSAVAAFRDMTAADLPEALCEAAVSLIHVTDHVHRPTTLAAQVITDIDLAILGQRQEVFDAYEAGIRREYGWVDEPVFCARRAKVLRRFLPPQRPRIYSTPYFQDAYERFALENIERSIAKLTGESVFPKEGG